MRAQISNLVLYKTYSESKYSHSSIHRQATDAISCNSCYIYISSCAWNMFNIIEIRSVIHFLTARNMRPSDIHCRMCKVYGVIAWVRAPSLQPWLGISPLPTPKQVRGLQAVWWQWYGKIYKNLFPTLISASIMCKSSLRYIESDNNTFLTKSSSILFLNPNGTYFLNMPRKN